VETSITKKAGQTADAIGSLGPGRPFLQPLAVAVVCLIFVVLLLVMGVMNLKTLDETLVAFMENKGLTIMENTRRGADRYFRQLMQNQHAVFDPETGTPMSEDAFSVQESFLIDFTELAQQIDFGYETNRLDHGQLASLITDESLRFVAFLDDGGRITFKSGSIPEEILHLANPVVQGYEAVKIHVFERSENTAGLGFVALRRQSDKGTIILGVDDEGFRYRSLRFSIQSAIQETVQDSDIAYLIVTDPHSRILGEPGELLESRKDEIETIPGDAMGVRTRKMVLKEQSVVEIAAPLVIGGERTGTMRLGLTTGVTDQILKKNRGSIFIAMGFMVVIALLSMWFLYKNQNRYLGRIQAMEERVHHAERLSALGRLAAGVAHEIRNPLNAISMATQRLQRDNLHKLTEVIRDEIRRLNEIVEEFFNVSRGRKLEFKRHNVTDLLEQIVLLMGEEVESKSIKLQTRWGDAPLMVSMDLDKMKQALINIMNNAMESISEEGFIMLTVEPRDQEWVSVKVSDTGTGLSSEEIRHMFDLDYTTKDKGLGLGLPLAHEIIRGHGGEIHVISRPGEGTTFEILLPLANE